ncbi:MAG: saccharopine dehydrogenase C-terminal domain-containing protein [Bacteroidales bacterium]
MKNVIILGAGMVGRAMAVDLSKKHKVTAVDSDRNALDMLPGRHNIHTTFMDVTDTAALATVLRGFDLVISAVPGFLGLQTMREVIDQKKDLVDITFLPEDVFHLIPLAKAKGVTVIMDCGIAPGLTNYIVGYISDRMKIDEVKIMVGGLPKVRSLPFEYKAPFSPVDVLEEYTRPARFVEYGKLVIRPALSDAELVEFGGIGTLEAFNTDGLRTLITTMRHIPFMKEKTLRYPGHIGLIRILKESGFFDKNPLVVNNTEIIPFDVTSRILINAWKLSADEPEFTVMRIIIKGTEEGVRKEVTYDLYDEYDPVEKLSSMARTTGFTATATAEMIMTGIFSEKGVFSPELAGKDPACFEFISNYLQARNIHYNVTTRNI